MSVYTGEQLIRNFSVMRGEIDIFLGAGASIQSGIPTGGDLVWQFKREIFCSEQKCSRELYKDLQLKSTRELLQDYFDKQGQCPAAHSPDEYSYYFERCYNSRDARKRFIESVVSGKEPSIGYLCLANLITSGQVKNIWTTNFDELLESAIKMINIRFPLAVCSSANQDSIAILNPEYPVICKLHGDYRYDKLQNTTSELRSLEEKLQAFSYQQLLKKGLIVIGYSGGDESVLSFFENHITESDFLSKGLFWTVRNINRASDRVKSLIEKARDAGKDAYLIEISGFDDFMYEAYQTLNLSNNIIDKIWRETFIRNMRLVFSGSPVSSFIKLNAYQAVSYPPCYTFETDITSWAQLREGIGSDDIVAALYKKHIYCFGEREHIYRVFGRHIRSTIVKTVIDEYILRKEDSIYIGMLYDLIQRTMASIGMIKYRKNKCYNPSTALKIQKLIRYDAVELAVTYADGKLYLNLLPTFYFTDMDGREIKTDISKFQISVAMSKVRNRNYYDYLRKWEQLLYSKKERKIHFDYEGFSIDFITPAVSCGEVHDKQGNWIRFPAWEYSEPLMLFSEDDLRKANVSQLKGLVQYGPIDCSYISVGMRRDSIKLAVLAPVGKMSIILSYLQRLNMRQARINMNDPFIINYDGFETIFRRSLIVPTPQQRELCISYPDKTAHSLDPAEFLAFFKRAIDHFSSYSADFHVLVIYIPQSFQKFREAKEISEDFNLHDAIKLYATGHNIKCQFIEERSIKADDPCKVIWGLSTGLYAKSSGNLWHSEAISDDIAYIGISYAQSKRDGVCIGCSQLFDSTGTGIRMLLRKIEAPRFVRHGKRKRNPYMPRDEAREMMGQLREQYYHSDPVSKLNRIVIHKTTPFMNEEIIGFTEAFHGIEDVELIQIQEFSHWRAIKFLENKIKSGIDSFSVKRGTVIQLDDNSFLLWTHGCIIHEDLAGSWHYYKGGRGIPAPLLVKRFHGNSSGDILVKEILMLTKMNWNSGDSLYKILPVTLDFAKVLARISKQEEAIYNKAYDFRYFM